MIHMPSNYPPVKVGRAIAGMGVPDLRGTLGTFTLYTDDPEEISRPVSGGQVVRVQLNGGRVVMPVQGPANPLRRDQRVSSVDLTLDVDPVEKVARIAVGESMAIVKQGEWSPWLIAQFPMMGRLATARGMLRVYAKQLLPRLELYVSPVNADPLKPDLPISFPTSFSRDMAREAGLFYTLGIAEDTSALRQGVFSHPEYLRQSRMVLDDELKLLRASLKRLDDGFLFFYLSSIDQNSHMLWGKYDGELLDTYRAIDSAIGEVVKGQPGADLIVMSDHGFTTFERAFNLNTWLLQQGYLTLKAGARVSGELLVEVDWAKTRAYALGLNGLYVNQAGREKYGIVKAGAEHLALLDELNRKLVAYRDLPSGRQIVEVTSAPSGKVPTASRLTSLLDTPRAIVVRGKRLWARFLPRSLSITTTPGSVTTASIPPTFRVCC